MPKTCRAHSDHGPGPTRPPPLPWQLLSLSRDLAQRRQTIPDWMAQRLEQQQRLDSQGLKVAAKAPAPAAPSLDGLAPSLETLSSEAERFKAASEAVEEGARGVQLTLGCTSELADQIVAVHVSQGCSTATDAAIEVEKENGGAAAAGGGGALPHLRKHLDGQKTTKQMRLC